ncbi:hypothetical protein CH76_10665 [Lysinibacillus sp. BF-4]|uniref:tRNA (adenosine(37)-N6)-threonylcarbamoyltransferase complex dimerization subunit type 1 TsaB n=1 Tax=Lysinibacillus sp. BF-4 TaxID=1473546 RepID=UPI0005060B57|nr:tRNA (adenosine(37)-N6)-threonylcarbamoyltransferase complex dimerization subunit type 1 TsaB [Lysinibacillus sp. BF-4]KFL42765.1 hypothetical protein CH76_10665 [Lysinibacillus sp. BF-4]
MIWLGIDTANAPLSVAVVKDGILVAEITQNNKLTHSVGAMPAVEEALTRAKLVVKDIDAIAVSAGPGSYTGVRIGVTIAKTLAWSLQKPLVSVSSLQALAYNVPYFTGVICTMIDARRQHVYSGAYQGEEVVIEDGHYAVIDLLPKLRDLGVPVLFVGRDVTMYWTIIEEIMGDAAIRAPFTVDLPRASEVIRLAMTKPQDTTVHTVTPTYRRIAEAEANWLKEQKSNGN